MRTVIVQYKAAFLTATESSFQVQHLFKSLLGGRKVRGPGRDTFPLHGFETGDGLIAKKSAMECIHGMMRYEQLWFIVVLPVRIKIQ